MPSVMNPRYTRPPDHVLEPGLSNAEAKAVMPHAAANCHFGGGNILKERALVHTLNAPPTNRTFPDGFAQT